MLGAGLLAMRHVRVAHQRPFDAFWAPIIDTQHPVLIMMGANHAYRFSNDLVDRYRAQHHIAVAGKEFFINLKKGEVIDESQLRTIELIGFGDVAAAARIASMLTRFNIRYDLRYGPPRQS
jgi:hypothetical protein